MSETAQILRKARALIEKPENWAQGDYCRVNGEGAGYFASQRLPAGSDCFCAIGSLAWVSDSTIREAETSAAFKVLAALTEEDGFDVHEFNDQHSHSAVLRLFDRAIARAESEAP